MIFSNPEKTRGRMTVPERTEYEIEAKSMGIDLKKEVTELNVLAMVLQKLSKRSANNAKIVEGIFRQS